MQLSLEGVTKQVGPETWLYPLTLAPRPSEVTVLLGATRAGKTSLLRIMAGLDRPTTGHVRVDGQDVTGLSVRKRNVAMVYQQFINYPSMTVAENIGSPLRLRRELNIEQRVRELAERLHIGQYLTRYPAELSGGEQQRVALARALAKRAPLMLLDEPLVNLDYKLREGLREELAQLFASGESTVIYATTEPGEALLLGGHTAVMDAGELLQYGATTEVFHRPRSLREARAFSDPPMNLLTATTGTGSVQLQGGPTLNLQLPPTAAGTVTVAVRASALRLQPRTGDVALAARVELSEISGSATFLHVSSAMGELVAQLTGVHAFEPDEPVTLHLSPAQVYVFDSTDTLLIAPERST